ncbi:F-type H+-transporting ATPase subunit epsilon [Polaribacter sp. KT25b]|uniref:F0F1 ATP synthase subunit epsilon n=1 Tax=Polaribacter sp. KT25b TaxID=1855336 RepID=UPI00087DB3ED|nr:F0F1 ATP synthase subunit epsilon [Polaribacter sp. KT25b]SDS37633.1 F-type H+-transporting ATPase subunit epsilon [Polaribacter sp. KT25b]
MFLEIVTPEAILFSSKIDSFSVPGIDGEFQMLNNHAPVVSVLKEGRVKIHMHTQQHLEIDIISGLIEPHIDDDKILTLAIKSGTLELKDNKAIILAD